MIMKRLMALVALASSAALAQQPQQPGDGNIPAPDLFDSQIACSAGLPSTVPTPSVAAMGETESALDTAIGMGNFQITNDLLLTNLGYSVPATVSNCGQGLGRIPFTSAAQGSIATDVAEGYAALYPKFVAVYGDPGDVNSTGTAGAVERAGAALAAAEADNTSSRTLLDSLRRTLADAREKDEEARAEYDAIAQGPIHEAAEAQWMARAAVLQSVEDYNDAVLEVIGAQATLDAMNYSGYVPLRNSELVGTVVILLNGMGTVNLSQLHNYTNANLNDPQVATVDEDGVTDSTDSNFDATGNLVVPMRLVGGELQSITATTGVEDARENRDNYKIAADALKQLSEDNLNVLLQPVIDEAARRAQAEADYYEQQFQNALADTTNQNPITVDLPSTPVNEAAPYSIASRHADYLTASNTRAMAEADLRTKAADRESATQNVIDAFQHPGSFYAQLVARRQALKAEADQRAADSSSMILTDAATAAANALTEAEEALAAYQALVGDPEGPVTDLIDTLLETGGDDGRAVVDAISRTWDETVDNRDSISALTADTDEGAEEDGPVTANRKAIAENTGKIDSIDGRVKQNEQDIGTLKGETDTNAGMIAANAGNIAANASGIAVNANSIVDNRALIGRNAATLVDHGARIDRNAANISVNSERIGANAAAIGMNSGLIADNRHMIGELRGDLDMVRAGVAASIALSRMPSVDGGGISFGAGTFAGEMAYAVGFQVERGFGTFDIGVTSSGGEIGAGVGVGLKIWH